MGCVLTAFANPQVLMASVILEKSMYFAFYSAIKDWIKPQSLLSNIFTGYSAELCRVPFVFPIEVQRPTLPPSPFAPRPSAVASTAAPLHATVPSDHLRAQHPLTPFFRPPLPV